METALEQAICPTVPGATHLTKSVAQTIARQHGHVLVDEGWQTQREVDGREHPIRHLRGSGCRRLITALSPDTNMLNDGMDQHCAALPQLRYYVGSGREV